jgi:phosphoribosylanthranilate isomerase
MILTNHTPQIKICGLTTVEEAVQCADLGADAIGLVFYDKSPRFVSGKQARNISMALPDSTWKIGVFVNESFDVIMQKVHSCKLTGIQLHGLETPELVDRLIKENLFVIKCLFLKKKPNISDVSFYKASAYLIECGKGKLPGGNAMTWNWAQAYDFGKKNPFILAGGLDPTNVVQAINQCFPDAVDVSSGVEISPGKKDIEKLKAFIKAIHGFSGRNILKNVFKLSNKRVLSGR